MDFMTPDQPQNQFNTNSIFTHQKSMTYVPPASFYPLNLPAAYPNHLKIYQKDQDIKKIMQEKNEDQKFVTNFVFPGSTSQKSTAGTVEHMKIFQAKNLLSEVIFLKKQLEHLKNEMSIKDQRFEMELNMANEIKKEISIRLAKFKEFTIQKVQVALSQRAKKRKNIRKRKSKYINLKKKAAKKRCEKHEAINKLLSEKEEEVNNIKREEGLKRQADSVLHKVRQKKFEAKKILSTLNAISKLRQVRSEEELAKGGYCSKSLTDTFNDAISHFQELWRMQLEQYQLEEKGLKIMLEGSTAPERAKSKYQAILYQWEQAIFGDAIFEGEKNLPSSILVETRKKWDRFLVASPTVMSSGIPSGWVLPSETEDEKWLKFGRKARSYAL